MGKGDASRRKRRAVTRRATVATAMLAALIGFSGSAPGAPKVTAALAAPTPPFKVKSTGQGSGVTPLVTSNAPTGLAPATIGALYDLHTGLAAPVGQRRRRAGDRHYRRLPRSERAQRFERF